MNYMLDNCVLDHLNYYTDDLVDFFEKTSKNNKYYTTSIQIEEVAQTGDDKKEIRIKKTFDLVAMRPIILNTEFVFDESRFGSFEFGDEENSTYEKIKGLSQKRIHDAMIGSAAKINCCTVVTDDKKLTERLIKENIPVLSTIDFYNKVS